LFSKRQVTHTLTQSTSYTKHTEQESDLRQLQQSGNEPINTKCEVRKALFRFHMLRLYIIASSSCLCRRDR